MEKLVVDAEDPIPVATYLYQPAKPAPYYISTIAIKKRRKLTSCPRPTHNNSKKAKLASKQSVVS
jgi:hypothetical protein